MLLELLMGIRSFLITKDLPPLQTAINELRSQLDYEPTAISQLSIALYGFSDAVMPRGA
jgi:hypothetical protein